jgi:phosphoenolpyruvate synthase/pyruvate phosphate dikinase
MFGIFPKRSDVKNIEIPNSVYFFEDYTGKELNEESVGRKGLSLFHLKDMDIPIPSFFVINPTVYNDIVFKAFDKNIVMLLESQHLPEPKQLFDLMMKAKFDGIHQEDILRSYSRISGFSDAWVSVRSSVVFPERPDVSFAGVFSTELNVRGFENVLEAIKLAYASIFNDKVSQYAKSHGINLTNLKMAIIVQKMVQAEVSGVAYTLDPVTEDKTKMSIETVFGLGDVIASGELTPDRYLLNKKDLSFIEKHISPQEWMRVRTLATKKSGQHFGSVEKIQISANWSHQQKLEDNFVQDVAKVALIIEDKCGEPQDIEWVWEGGNVWILQSKPVLMREKPQELYIHTPNFMYEDISPVEKTEVANSDLVDLAAGIVQSVKREELAEIITEVEAKNPDVIINQFENSNEADFDFVEEESLINRDFAQVKIDPVVVPVTAPVHQEKIEISTDVADELTSLDNELRQLSELLVVKDFEKYKTETIEEKEIEQVEEVQIEKEELVGITQEEMPEMELVCSGQGASFGVATGEVKIIREPSEVSKLSSAVLTKRNVLVIDNYSAEMEKVLFAVGGVVMRSGGLTSDLSVICRELNIPAVVGVGEAISLLHDGELVQIDGNFGSIYRVITPVSQVESLLVERNESVNENVVETFVEEKEPNVELEKEKTLHEVVDQLLSKSNYSSEEIVTKQIEDKLFTATRVFVSHSTLLDAESVAHSDGIFTLDLDKLMLEGGRHPLESEQNGSKKEYTDIIARKVDKIASMASGNEVVISIGSSTIEEFRKLPSGHLFEQASDSLKLSGAGRLLKNNEFLKLVIEVIKTVRNIHRSKNVSIAIHSPMNAKALTEVKKEFGAAGLRRSSTFNIYAVIDNPAEVLLVDDLLGAEIDGLIMNMKKLACEMQGLDYSDLSAKYDVTTPSVLKLVDTVMTAVKASRNNVIVLCENSKALVKHCVSKGVYGISVLPQSIKELRKTVAQEEADIVLGRRKY